MRGGFGKLGDLFTDEVKESLGVSAPQEKPKEDVFVNGDSAKVYEIDKYTTEVMQEEKTKIASIRKSTRRSIKTRPPTQKEENGIIMTTSNLTIWRMNKFKELKDAEGDPNNAIQCIIREIQLLMNDKKGENFTNHYLTELMIAKYGKSSGSTAFVGTVTKVKKYVTQMTDKMYKALGADAEAEGNPSIKDEPLMFKHRESNAWVYNFIPEFVKLSPAMLEKTVHAKFQSILDARKLKKQMVNEPTAPTAPAAVKAEPSIEPVVEKKVSPPPISSDRFDKILDKVNIVDIIKEMKTNGGYITITMDSIDITVNEEKK